MKYDVACRALAEAATIDEVKDIYDKAEALRIYTRQAKDTEGEENFTRIRLRAKRELGARLLADREAGKLHEGRPRKKKGSESEPLERIKIADFGIDKKLSAESQDLARLPEPSYQVIEAKVLAAVRANEGHGTRKVMTAQEKKEKRAQKEKLLGEYQRALPNKKYGVIVADPEWKFETYSTETGMDRASENHYPTTETKKIKVRDVGSIAADSCVLFLWATNPMLPAAMAVMKAWGFEYQSNYVWGKDKIGLGYWNREKHELLLIGTRGNPPAPAPGTQRESLIMAPRGSHSAKPDVFLEMIEQYYPTLPKIELNRRGSARQGWDAWGNESEERITDDSRTNHDPKTVPDSYGTDAAQSKASVSEPASDHHPKAPHVPVADAGSPSSLPEIILPGVAPSFEHFAAFTDLTNPLHGRAS